MAIRFFDMLAGIGGFSSGLEAVGGFECVSHCEIDEYANQTYNAIYDTKVECFLRTPEPSIPARCRISTLFAEISLVNLFLIAGKRRGFADDARGTLFSDDCKSLFTTNYALPPVKDLHFCCLKMFLDCYHMTGAGRLRSSSLRWMTWGTISRG